MNLLELLSPFCYAPRVRKVHIELAICVEIPALDKLIDVLAAHPVPPDDAAIQAVVDRAVAKLTTSDAGLAAAVSKEL